MSARLAAVPVASPKRRARSLTASWGGALMAALALTTQARAADPPSYLVGVGDVLQVSFYAGGEKQDDFTSTVSSTGAITSPLIGDLKVAGMTTGEIADTMTTLLARSYFVNPQVLVSVKEYAGQVLVMGAVRQPGAYGFQAGITALKACLLAGGFTEYATPSKVKITRVVNGHSTTESVNLDKVGKGKAPDPELLKGDRIDVGRRRF
ncbi:MAG: polysaccharide biosynthesis/export family protein [Candidatus Eiseniibacteriota bacterium]